MTIDETHLTSLTCTTAEFGEVGAELLARGNLVRFTARGSSMHPLVRDGDILLVSPLPPGGVKIGDIVLCTTGNGQVLVHRVLRKQRAAGSLAFLMQGDQAMVPDGLIPAEQVHGKLTEIERSGRVLQMTSPAVRFLGLIMVCSQRVGLRQSFVAKVASGLIKRLPGFSSYLN
jgi:signal peptidase